MDVGFWVLLGLLFYMVVAFHVFLGIVLIVEDVERKEFCLIVYLISLFWVIGIPSVIIGVTVDDWKKRKKKRLEATGGKGGE